MQEIQINIKKQKEKATINITGKATIHNIQNLHKQITPTITKHKQIHLNLNLTETDLTFLQLLHAIETHIQQNQKTYTHTTTINPTTQQQIQNSGYNKILKAINNQ